MSHIRCNNGLSECLLNNGNRQELLFFHLNAEKRSILYAPFLWNPSITVGDELFWWTDRNAPFRTGIYLFDEAMKQIKEKGAIPMFRSMETSPKGVERLYHRRGLRRIETTHIGIP